jgi:vacuolar-type H+-ATPase subunit E/Vma4
MDDNAPPEPTQTEQDLAGSLRMAAQLHRQAQERLNTVTQHVAQRAQNLEHQALRDLRDADRLLRQQRPREAAEYLQRSAESTTTARELLRVLDLLR